MAAHHTPSIAVLHLPLHSLPPPPPPLTDTHASARMYTHTHNNNTQRSDTCDPRNIAFTPFQRVQTKNDRSSEAWTIKTFCFDKSDFKYSLRRHLDDIVNKDRLSSRTVSRLRICMPTVSSQRCTILLSLFKFLRLWLLCQERNEKVADSLKLL